jgi:hypothetical protein
MPNFLPARAQTHAHHPMPGSSSLTLSSSKAKGPAQQLSSSVFNSLLSTASSCPLSVTPSVPAFGYRVYCSPIAHSCHSRCLSPCWSSYLRLLFRVCAFTRHFLQALLPRVHRHPSFPSLLYQSLALNQTFTSFVSPFRCCLSISVFI